MSDQYFLWSNHNKKVHTEVISGRTVFYMGTFKEVCDLIDKACPPRTVAGYLLLRQVGTFNMMPSFNLEEDEFKDRPDPRNEEAPL